MRLSRLVAVAAFGARLAAADVTPENAKRASDLFDQGRKAIAAKQIDAACDLFARSLVLDPQIGTRLNLAACLDDQGKPVEAYNMFEAAASEAERTGKRARGQFAREQMRVLEGKLVRVHLVLTNAAGATVKLGGVAIDPAQRQLVKAGKIALEVTAPDRKPYRVEKTVDQGSEITIDVPALEPIDSGPGDTQTPPPVDTGTAKQPPPQVETKLVDRPHGPLPYIVGGVGGVLLLTAGGLTLHARGRWQSAIDDRDAGGVTSAQHEADVATVLSIAGAVALTAGVVIWVRGRGQDRVVITPSANGLAAMGTF